MQSSASLIWKKEANTKLFNRISNQLQEVKRHSPKRSLTRMSCVAVDSNLVHRKPQLYLSTFHRSLFGVIFPTHLHKTIFHRLVLINIQNFKKRKKNNFRIWQKWRKWLTTLHFFNTNVSLMVFTTIELLVDGKKWKIQRSLHAWDNIAFRRLWIYIFRILNWLPTSRIFSHAIIAKTGHCIELQQQGILYNNSNEPYPIQERKS